MNYELKKRIGMTREGNERTVIEGRQGRSRGRGKDEKEGKMERGKD